MTSQTPDIQAVLQRLEKLERQNRRFKRVGALALTGVGVLIFMSQAASDSHTVEAQRFIVKDAEGHVRAEFGLSGKAAGLTLYDQKGTTQARLEAGAGALSGGQLELRDESGKAYSGLWAGFSGAMIYAHDQDGNEIFLGSLKTADSRSEKLRITGKPTIVMMDKNERDIWRAP